MYNVYTNTNHVIVPVHGWTGANYKLAVLLDMDWFFKH